MESYKHSKTLFTKNGEPLCFSMVPCYERTVIRQIIEHGGGKLVHPTVAKNAIKLVPSSVSYADHPESTLYSTYVRDCASKNALLSRNGYYVKSQGSTCASSVKSSKGKLRVVRQRLEYTIDEEFAIANYVEENKGAMAVRGNKLYKAMERDQIVPRHTWQSLKEHYIKKLLPRIQAIIPRKEAAGWVSKDIPTKPVCHPNSVAAVQETSLDDATAQAAHHSQNVCDETVNYRGYELPGSVDARKQKEAPSSSSMARGEKSVKNGKRKRLLNPSDCNASSLFSESYMELNGEEEQTGSPEPQATSVSRSNDLIHLDLSAKSCEASCSPVTTSQGIPASDASTCALSSLYSSTGGSEADIEDFTPGEGCETIPALPTHQHGADRCQSDGPEHESEHGGSKGLTDEEVAHIQTLIGSLENEICDSRVEELRHPGECQPSCKCKNSVFYKDSSRALVHNRAILAYYSSLSEGNIVENGANLLAELVLRKREARGIET